MEKNNQQFKEQGILKNNISQQSQKNTYWKVSLENNKNNYCILDFIKKKFLFQFNSFVFPAPMRNREQIQDVFQDNIKVTKLIFKNKSGQIVPFIKIYSSESQKKQNGVIFFHGNASDLSNPNFLVELVKQTRTTFYSIQYPTYGQYETNDKDNISARIKTDAQQFQRQLTKKVEIIAIMGYSIGSGPATYLASKVKAPKLILLSPFSLISNIVKDFYGIGRFIGWLVYNHFDNEAYIKQFNGELLVIHGQRDEVINIKHSEKIIQLYKQKNSKKEPTFIRSIYMTHNISNIKKDITEPIKAFLG